jgi:plastocyanin
MALSMKASRATRCVVRAQAVRPNAAKMVKVAGLSIASFALAMSANAATVKLGSDGGALVFDPEVVTIAAGDSVTWVNNAGFPHNVVFDEDAVPSGVNADSLSHEDYLNAKNDTVSTKFTAPGTYGYYCEPHAGAGMKGTVVVQ